jgi:hypothetical protein
MSALSGKPQPLPGVTNENPWREIAVTQLLRRDWEIEEEADGSLRLARSRRWRRWDLWRVPAVCALQVAAALTLGPAFLGVHWNEWPVVFIPVSLGFFTLCWIVSRLAAPPSEWRCRPGEVEEHRCVLGRESAEGYTRGYVRLHRTWRDRQRSWALYVEATGPGPRWQRLVGWAYDSPEGASAMRELGALLARVTSWRYEEI